MTRRYWRAMCLVSTLFLLSACGFTGNLRGNPGFASFGLPSTLPQADRQFAISLGPIPLRLATMISRPVFDHEDAWISDTLSDVRAVRVYVYEVDGKADRVIDHMDATRTKLVFEGWEQIVVVREDGGLATALVRQESPEMVRGIVVMYEEDEELVLVNLIGKIEPETFTHIMEGLDIEIPTMKIEDSHPKRVDI